MVPAAIEDFENRYVGVSRRLEMWSIWQMRRLAFLWSGVEKLLRFQIFIGNEWDVPTVGVLRILKEKWHTFERKLTYDVLRANSMHYCDLLRVSNFNKHKRTQPSKLGYTEEFVDEPILMKFGGIVALIDYFKVFSSRPIQCSTSCVDSCSFFFQICMT